MDKAPPEIPTGKNKTPPIVPRRSFIKLGGAVAGTAAWIAACGNPDLAPPGELEPANFDSEYVIYNGKTVSLNELDITPLSYAITAKNKLNEIKQGTFSRTNPGGYSGDPFPADWELDAIEKSVIIINETDTGDYISQILIGRKRVGEVPLSEGGATDFINDIAGAMAYNDHSLLVVGPKDQTLWFGNVESENVNGTTRVVFDSREGKVYQINANNPNILEKWFRGEEIQMNIGEIDILSGDSNFKPTLTPFHEKFINFLELFVNKLPPDLNKNQKLEKINNFFSGLRFSPYKTEALKELLGDSDDTQKIIEIITRYKADLPFNAAELAVVNGVLSETIKKRMQGIRNEASGDMIKGQIPSQEGRNVTVVENIIKERVSLPKTTPELYFVQVKNKKDELKWFLVGRYPIWENDVDRTVITSKPDGFSIGRNWFTFGEVNSDIVNNGYMRKYEKKIDAFPFDEVKKFEKNINNPLEEGLPDLVEVRRVGSEAIVYGWDPAESNLKHKINPGLVIVDEKGENRFLKISLEKFWNNNIQDLPILANRWLPILGNSPRIIKEVTENVKKLIQQGYESASIFGLDTMADYSLLANLANGIYTDYNFLKNTLSPEAYKNLVEPSEFLKGGADNTILISSFTKDGEPVKIYRYNTENGQKAEEITMDHSVIMSPREIGTFEDGTAYVVIAKNGNEVIVAREEDIFPLGARSAEKLTAVMTVEVAAVIAAIYGGYSLINSSIAGSLSEEVVASLAASMIP